MTPPDDLAARHAKRWRDLDPLVTPPDPIDLADGDVPLSVADDAGRGRGRVRLHTAGASEESALWGALRTHRLHLEVEGPDPAAICAALLDRFDDHLAAAARPGDDDEAAMVVLPSKDVALVLPLVRRGFHASVVIAVRTLDRPPASGPQPALGPPLAPGVSLRSAEVADLDRLTDLAVDLHGYDAQFGGVTHRADGPRLLAASMEHQLASHPGWTWVAAVDGDIVGFVQVQPPTDAGWIAPVVARDPVAYLSQLHVVPDRRHTGIGAALAGRAQQVARDDGCAAILLHHVPVNPLSAPFWGRQGYRPLWTAWQRRPAVR